jgi:hypothetical protein
MRIVEIAVAIPVAFFIIALAVGVVRDAWGHDDDEVWPKF